MKAEKPIWFAPRKCWRKRYCGKCFYFPGSLTEDEAAAAWLVKKQELDGKAEDPLADLYKHEASKANKRAKFYELVGDSENAR